MKKIIPFVLIIFLFNSCISEWDKALDEKTMDYQWIYSTTCCNQKNTSIKIVIDSQQFRIHIKIRELEKYIHDSIPIDSGYQINYFLRFFTNNGIVYFPNELSNSYTYKKYKGTSNMMIIPLSVVYRNEKTILTANVPYILLKQIKKGKQKLYGELFAEKQCQTTSDSSINRISIPQIKTRWCFLLDMPSIYKTMLYSAGIYLQNDSVFSPIGMDFSLTRFGLPDIYWTVFINAKDSKDFSNYFWRSAEDTYAFNYTDSDTVSLIHLFPNDRLIIGVYDRDDFSHDDFIGDWYGKINTLVSDTFKSIAFDHITSFNIRAEQKGCIN